jgi:uncharacterized protein (TIRG00374 family)
LPSEVPAARLRALFSSQLAQYLFSGVLSAFFLWIAFRGTDFPTLFGLMRDANYWWIMGMFICLLASHLVRAWRWRFLLDPIKRGIGLRNLFAGVMIGYLFNNILPRAGELARPYALGHMESISRSSAFGTIVVERMIDVLCFLILVALMPLVYNGALLESFPWLRRTGILITAATAAGLAGLVALMARRDWTDRLLEPVGRFLPSGLRSRVNRIVHAFLDGFLFVKDPKLVAVIAASSAVIWFLYILMIYVAFFAFGLGDLGLGGALVVEAISSIGMALPTPGGTGTYHAFTSQTLNKLFQVAMPVALSFATVTHAVTFIGVSIVGLWYFLRDRIRVAEVVSRKREGNDR